MKWRPLTVVSVRLGQVRMISRRPAVFTGAGERLPVVIHLLVAELALDQAGQHAVDPEVLLEHHVLARW
jgi:hypothetical protein